MCKKDRGNIIDDKNQKIKDYQKEYRKNITNEQKQKYKSNQKQYRTNMTDEQKQRIKDYQKQYRENMTDEEKQKHKKNIYQKSKNKKEEIIKNNEMQANGDKCHVLISTDQKLHVNIGTLQIENSKCEKRLGANIDSKLSFEKHLNIICGKARAKISALGRVAPFMNIEKRKMIMNAFFNSQFSYCSLT